MGVLWRKRSVLLKIAVVGTTVWFTIAFLLYSDNRSSENVVAEEGDSYRRRGDYDSRNNLPMRPMPLRYAETKKNEVEKKEADSVLLPPQNMAGEMGKPVLLPANLSSKLTHFIYQKFERKFSDIHLTR